MSDYPSKSQRMEWNNDGMDPDWKPDLTPTETIGKKIDALINASRSIAEINFKDCDLNSMGPGDFVKITISATRLKEFIEAFDALTKTKLGDG